MDKVEVLRNGSKKLVDLTTDQLPEGTTNKYYPISAASKLAGIETNATADQAPTEIKDALLTVDGANSGLDADLVDGLQGTHYLDRANHVGNQAISTITNLQTSLNSKANTSNTLTTNTAQTITAQKSFTSNPFLVRDATVNTILEFGSLNNTFPSFNTRASGTRISLYNILSSTATEVAVGVGAGTFWQSIPINSTNWSFRWFGGTTELASLRGDGLLTVKSLTVQESPPAFTPSLVNGWQAYPAPWLPRYTKSASGIVTCSGLIRYGTYSSSTIVFTFPAGYRPLNNNIFSGLVSIGTTYAPLDLRVSTTGVCTITNPPAGNPIWISLSSITFQT